MKKLCLLFIIVLTMAFLFGCGANEESIFIEDSVVAEEPEVLETVAAVVLETKPVEEPTEPETEPVEETSTEETVQN